MVPYDNGFDDLEFGDHHFGQGIGAAVNVPQGLSFDRKQKHLEALVYLCKTECQMKGRSSLEAELKLIFEKLTTESYAAFMCGFEQKFRTGEAELSTWDLKDELINNLHSSWTSYTKLMVDAKMTAAYEFECGRCVPSL